MENSNHWINTRLACKILGTCERTLCRYRQSAWVEGVHFLRWQYPALSPDKAPACRYRYNEELLRDWVRNRFHPEAHQKAIDVFLAGLPENQPRKGGRKPSSAA